MCSDSDVSGQHASLWINVCITAVCVLTGDEPTGWRGTGPLRSRGHKSAMWLWEVHFRIHKHTLPVWLKVSLSVYCMYSAFQPASQTDRPHLGSDQWKAIPLPSSLPSPCSLRLSSHPGRGSGEVGVVGQTGPAVWPQTSECVYVGGREGSTGLITDPATHWASQTATSQPVAATELQQKHCRICTVTAWECVLVSQTSISSI